MKPIRLMTVAPGHFHAALVQKTARDGVHPRAYVYAPLDPDLLAHLDRVAAFNARPDGPTAWELDVRAGAGFFDRFLREQPGNTVVLSGRNRPKIDLMLAAVSNSLHVLADKPWVVEAEDFPKVERVLQEADFREVVAWDMMTERHEVTSQLQRALVRDPVVFGDWQSLALESVHHLKKTVAGRPLRRPWWWFDPAVSGEAMADVGTHLADLALWLVCPDDPVDYRRDVRMLDADRWPLVLSEAQFAELTGLPGFPPELAPRVVEGHLYYAGNNSAALDLRGVRVTLATVWEYESPGGDTHRAVARGCRAVVSVEQDPGGMPEVYVTPTEPDDHEELFALLAKRADAWQGPFPGLAVADMGGRARFDIPAALRVGHEAHFAAVLDEFVRYFHAPRSVPAWERPNLLAKYYITTQAVELARQKRQQVG